ncbi:hypothetical protein ACFV10_28590 [Streptomyces cyaneofuscatus]|uniref:hypothetical protein n=1 Tax=Streptomyces cyaneofuscatus TaxID=66883 RepID=UPI003691D6A2
MTIVFPDIPLGHSIPSHRVHGWCSHCPGRSMAEELAAWQVDALNRALGRSDEMEQLRTKNERMRHELKVMYGGAFDIPPAPADRAAHYREAADHIDHLRATMGAPTVRDCFANGLGHAANDLRRLADDAAAGVQPPTTSEADTLARVSEWVTSDVVTATSGFGDGYREAQRDIRDIIHGRATPPAAPAAPEATP